MTSEEQVFIQNGPESLPDNLDAQAPISEYPIETPSRPWGYLVAGMSVTLLAVALGAVLGYLARPALDPVTIGTDAVKLREAPAAVSAPAQPNTVKEAESQASSTGGSSAIESAPDASAPTPTIMDFVLTDARHFKGSPAAPVTIVEFSDFTCPYCGRFSAETLPQIQETYIDTGKVRFAYKHFAILGPASIRTAEASECAAEQDKFWEYHDQLFAEQASVRGLSNDDPLTGLADGLGLDTSAFAECLASGRYSDQIQRESQAVASMGVRGTPGFLVNGVFISGAQPFEAFQQIIEEQLQAVE